MYITSNMECGLIAYCTKVHNFKAAFVYTISVPLCRFLWSLCFYPILFGGLYFFKHILEQVLFTRGNVPMPISELPGCVAQLLIISILQSTIQISQFNLLLWALNFPLTSQAIFFISIGWSVQTFLMVRRTFPFLLQI